MTLGATNGDAGGHIVAEGTPEDIAGVEESYTGQYLRELLVRRPAAGRAGGAGRASAAGAGE